MHNVSIRAFEKLNSRQLIIALINLHNREIKLTYSNCLPLSKAKLRTLSMQWLVTKLQTQKNLKAEAYLLKKKALQCSLTDLNLKKNVDDIQYITLK